jgi:hypothetical protein
MSINGASTMFCFTSWVIYVQIGCTHPFIRYSQLLLAKTKATFSLLHPENERQWGINCFSSCIFPNQGIVLIFMLIMELLTALIGKTQYINGVTQI